MLLVFPCGELKWHAEKKVGKGKGQELTSFVSFLIKTGSRCREKLTVAQCQADGTVVGDYGTLVGFLRLGNQTKES